MPQVYIRIGQSVKNQHLYKMSDEKIKYLFKFVEAINEESEEDIPKLTKEEFLADFRKSLQEVKAKRTKPLKNLIAEKGNA